MTGAYVSKKKIKMSDESWVEAWCKDNVATLLDYRGMVLAIHRVHGILCVAKDSFHTMVQVGFLRRSISKDAWYVEVDPMLKKIRHDHDEKKPTRKDDEPKVVHGYTSEQVKKRLLPKRQTLTFPTEPLSPPPDESDDDITYDGASAFRSKLKKDPSAGSPGETTLASFAKQHDLRLAETLLYLIDIGFENAHVNMVLEDSVVEMLKDRFIARVNDKVEPSPFPSPHKQPAFQPRPRGPHKPIVLD